MFRVEKVGPRRLDLAFEGQLDTEQMTELVRELVAASEGLEEGRLMYRVGDFDMPTFGALVVELKNLPALWGAVRRFEKCALVAPQSWVRTVGEIEGALIPGLEIKAFEPDDEDDAEAWLAD